MHFHEAVGLVSTVAVSSVAVATLPRWFSILSCAVLSTPWWLPELVVAIRFRIFTAVNGDDGVQFPNENVGGRQFKALYKNKGVQIRSRQNHFGLSDFFWYLLSPAHYIHQEHLEADDPMYGQLSKSTTILLRKFNEKQMTTMATSAAEELFGQNNVSTWNLVRLRDFFFPMFANLFHELVFEAPCPEEDRDLIVSSAHNVIHALKCCTMRDMKLRARLTKRLEEKIVEYKDVLEGVFDENISLHQSALHLQGAFFHTGCVQLSEAMAHLVLAIAQTPGVQAKLQADDTGNYIRMVMQEQLRLFPLFGVAHRIASNDIEFNGEIIPTGTVLLFNYPAYQTTGFDRPHEFVPERWEKLTERECNYIPFGVVGNRPCPGRQLSEVWMKAIATTMVERVEFQSSIPHTRSLPGRGQCLIASRKHGGLAQLGGVKSGVVMGLMAAQEATEGVVRSVAQLIYGTQMLLDAKKKKMALRFFQGADVDTLDPIET